MNREQWSRRISEIDGATVPRDQKQLSEDGRSEFERDRSRILHTRAFRRLQSKTQVFRPGDLDFYRTRLTHSLECAQIGKALSLRLWYDENNSGASDLVEAACLAHDIGHPPFGHLGEKALSVKVPFEGNAQTIRVLTSLERKVEGYGLDVTLGTLASVTKYPFTERKGRKRFIYVDDADRFINDRYFQNSPFRLHDDDSASAPKPFPMMLMEWADDVAYSTHDIEDGINAGFITWTHLCDDLYFRPIVDHTMCALERIGVFLCSEGSGEATG